MPELTAPPDQAARDRIEHDLDCTLFVEAGAGSGKTRALVSRIVALVASGTAELRHIAAITFTEKAGAELRDRTRRALENLALSTDDTEVRLRCQAALDQLDSAAIGTLHAFAERLLRQFPVEAGLPPRVEVHDEVNSSIAFERRWTAFRDDLLSDPLLERTLLLFLAAGVRDDALRVLALAFNQNWDLVAERVPATAPAPPATHAALDETLRLLDTICAERAHCRDTSDKLCARLGDIADYVARLRAIADDVDLLEALGPDGAPKAPSFAAGNIGAKARWDLDVADLRGRIRTAGDALDTVRGRVAQACAERLGSAIRRFTLDAADERRAAGQLEFHDLLVLARSLLKNKAHGPTVRAALHGRYQRLLLDEFQDTDPIQIDLAVRIAAANPATPAAGALPWDVLPVSSGHLFMVGDPKQSIYRFRRADISTFLATRDRFGPEGGGVVELTANFRTAKPIIDWTNATFAALMAEPPDLDLPVPSQPDYVALQAVRPSPPTGPPVSLFGRFEHPRSLPADDLRAAEAADVAASIVRVLQESWTVQDSITGWRPARMGDITVLVPARTSLPFLEDALDTAGIPYRAESSSLVYATRAVRDLLMVLRAVDDPTDHLAIVAALRTPLLACGDDDLFRFRVEGNGRWSYLADQPDSVPPDDPVRSGLDYLSGLHRQRQWHGPSELLDSIARDRRAFELAVVEGRPRDVWRRLRFVIDQARAWTDATGSSLRQYLQWVEQQTAEGVRVAESVLPETDDDAVRIMTIHAAKGLEFPITIISGMTTASQQRRASADVAFPPVGGVGYRFGKHVMTDVYEAWKPIDEQMGFDERIRLLYVACTRARDHLILSLHRKARARPPDKANSHTNAELLVKGMGELLEALPDAANTADARHPQIGAVLERPASPPPFEEWQEELTAALKAARRPTAVAATALTDEGRPDAEAEPDPGLQKRPRDLDLPPWLKGRYGSAVGRAVHGVLQTVDLATGAGVDAAVAAQCEAEAVPERTDDVRRLVHHALSSTTVQEAARHPHWREVYVCTPIGNRLLEGYIDLLYRGPEGLVVVDYKTAATTELSELDRRVEGYRLQGSSYATAVAAATGEKVARITFLFLTPDGPVTRDLTDVGTSVARVRRIVTEAQDWVIDSSDPW